MLLIEQTDQNLGTCSPILLRILKNQRGQSRNTIYAYQWQIHVGKGTGRASASYSKIIYFWPWVYIKKGLFLYKGMSQCFG